uniref:anti-CBASS protein Acb1 family protein n=1 Tax=Serratia quinivorans TaxID=137545 RepID=UPI0035C70D7E
MNKNLQLAVNHALNDARLARARMAAFNPGMGLDAKRSTAWCEYGFKEELTFDDLYKLYRRGGIAFGAVNKITSHCWKTYPEIIQGDKYDKSKPQTAWERSIKATLNSRLWKIFAEADKRRLVGRWSGILLHIRDDKAWNLPVTKGRGLAKVTTVWAGALKPYSLDTNISSVTYGEPTMWEYTEELPNGASRRVQIHPERVFILGDFSEDAIGFLEPSYNAFVSLEKVEGGSGESFLKNAARQLNVNFEKEIDFNNLASMYGVNVDELQDKFNEAALEVNRGNDVLLTTQGATVTPLVTAVADPEPTYSVNLQTAAAGVDIPAKVLVGMQTGERASSEDQKYMNARCQSRRAGELSYDIEDFANKLIELRVIDGTPEMSVTWDDLNEQTAIEKLDSALKMSQINTASLATGEQVFAVNEIREAAGYETDDSDPLGEGEEDDEEVETSNSSE